MSEDRQEMEKETIFIEKILKNYDRGIGIRDSVKKKSWIRNLIFLRKCPDPPITVDLINFRFNSKNNYFNICRKLIVKNGMRKMDKNIHLHNSYM